MLVQLMFGIVHNLMVCLFRLLMIVINKYEDKDKSYDNNNQQIKINVITLSGKTISMKVNSDETIENVKK